MKLTDVRAAKSRLKDGALAVIPLSEPARRRGMDKLHNPKAARPVLAVGIGRGRAKRDFKLAVRIYDEDPAAAERVVAKLLKGDKALAGELQVVRGIRYKPRGLTLSSGTSGAHINVGAGTLGAFVQAPGDNETYLLSNNHVLADSCYGQEDDPIVQPSVNDANGQFDVVGRLTRWIPLGMALVDAAIARISDDATHFIPLFYDGIGSISATPVDGVGNALYVTKLGRATEVTHGHVSAYELDGVVMNYKGGLSVTFNNQIEIVGNDGAFSASGDSGSLIIDEDSSQPYALLFGGGSGDDGIDRTVAHYLPEVLGALGVSLAT